MGVYRCFECNLYFDDDYEEPMPNPNDTLDKNNVVCPNCFEANLKDYDDEDENGIQGI